MVQHACLLAAAGVPFSLVARHRQSPLEDVRLGGPSTTMLGAPAVRPASVNEHTAPLRISSPNLSQIRRHHPCT
ncbi:hypothetical protein M406DRAFT_323845 [Cryphonectria parasitica EP155]|uniref:Uncharacterized protein n=1 Tax=Cryphonectria parasitica (strain ATCC 38755 / EP155) TaxID=660469 RepID=A0A9P5CJM5_CRYP1|nr:uncharacterized protein M406DRAFT_323845 [Cryphonectria parasitica EP155]KAF3761389.1 hypothetical protein M406DRAFT_323845 [Cryphonectria parasitica EP155]